MLEGGNRVEKSEIRGFRRQVLFLPFTIYNLELFLTKILSFSLISIQEK